MGAQVDDGSSVEEGQRLYNIDIRRLELACSNHLHRIGTTKSKPETLARLAQTISRGDKSIESAILRVWGIR